jgi:CheY-like chemotaxis protein
MEWLISGKLEEEKQMPDLKIIVADDSPTSLMYMGILLKRIGATVLPAENGFEVLKLLNVIEPDVVMLDIGMGTLDGITTLRYIKENKGTSDLPVIMVSGDSSRQMIQKCKELGCAGYLTKPVRADALHSALKCAVSPGYARRHHLRAPVNKKVIVKHEGTEYELYAETLSEGGIYIRKKDPFPVGSDVEVTLPIEDGGSVSLEGDVVHVKGFFGGEFKILPGMGIRFKEIPGNKIEVLRNYIEKLIAGDIPESLKETVIKPSKNRTGDAP